ncbi:hypothetical protein [Campylobacter sp.]|uniref:hypothetical protein n=1 Tax=Campylobacter sp. TaxID=205 RepID=UPI0025C66C40|nr:hypothetical protein [Campylobacter sp.]
MKMELGKKSDITKELIFNVSDSSWINVEHHIISYYPIDSDKTDLEYVTFTLEVRSDYDLEVYKVLIEKIYVFKNRTFKIELIASTILDYTKKDNSDNKEEIILKWVKNEVRNIMRSME